MAKRRANGEGNLRKRKDGRWEGRYTAGRDPETGKAIYKNVLGKTQAEAKAKLKAAIEEAKGLDAAKVGRYTVGQWMEVWFEHYAKVKVRPSSTRPTGVTLTTTSSPISAKSRWKSYFSGIAEVLQEAVGEGQGGSTGIQAPVQRAQRQDGAEHPSNHFLCHETGSGAETTLYQPGGWLRPAKVGALVRCRPTGGATPVLSERGKGQWCV